MRRARGGVAAVLATLVLASCGGGVAVDRAGEAARSVAGKVLESATSSSPSVGDGDVRSLPRLVDDAEWVEREGTRALKVTPNAALRRSTDPTVYDEAWRRVVVALPDADSPGLKDQFVCHATFASTKDAWFLEPARPEVGYWETVKAGCNPGSVRDVG